jgi:hypothetical protein
LGWKDAPAAEETKTAWANAPAVGEASPKPKSVRDTVFPEDVYDPKRDSWEGRRSAEALRKANPDGAGPLVTGAATFANARLFGLPNKYQAFSDAVEALATPGKSFKKTLRMRSDYYDQLLAEERDKNPISSFGANLYGLMGGGKDINSLTGLANAGMKELGKRAPGGLALLKRLGAAGTGASIQDGLTSAVENVGDLVDGKGGEYAKKVLGRAAHAFPWAVGGQAVLGEVVGPLLGTLLKGAVKPNKTAQELQKRGVENLTIGQMDPDSVLGQMEEVAESGPLGPIIKSQRSAGKEAWQKSVLSEGVMPGQGIKAQGDNAEMLNSVYEGIEPTYSAIKNTKPSARSVARPVNTQRLKKAFDLAAEDKGVLSADADVASVKRFLGNQASIIERQGAANPTNLIAVRSNIRKMKAGLPEGDAKRLLLQRAEETVTNRLKYVLPEEALADLRAADKQYSNYKVLSNAVGRSNMRPEGFTPNDLTQAVKASADEGVFARKAAGGLQEMAELGRKAFDPRRSDTGARILGTVPLLRHVVPLANTPAGKRLMMGQTWGQQRLGAPLAEALQSIGPSSRLPLGLRHSAAPEPGRQLMPAWAYEDPEDQEAARALAEALGSH